MGILENGASLVSNLVPQTLVEVPQTLAEVPQKLASAASRLVEAIAINSFSERKRRNRTVVVKRRNLHREQLADLTNLYFRLPNIPIRLWRTLDDWRRWAADCSEML